MEHEQRLVGGARWKPELRDVAGKRMIEGYAAVFYREGDPGTEYVLFDDLVERVMATAFQEWYSVPAATRDCRALFNHDRSALLGREANGSLSLTVDNVGLRYSVEAPDTQVGRDMIAYLTRGDLTGSSFSFRPTSCNWREDGDMLYRELTGLEVFDVGPVTFPAYTATSAGVRNRDAADLEALRREAARYRRRMKGGAPWKPEAGLRRRQVQVLGAEMDLDLLA